MKIFPIFSTVFFNETGETAEFFNDKKVIDVGSGHGLMTTRIGEYSSFCVGVELSKAVESAYRNNKNKRAWFVQGDLQFLPFDSFCFDVLYSSGVIHHTNNTELSLSLVEDVLKKNGKIFLWLYHPQQSAGHNLLLHIRKITARLPLKLAFYFIVVFIFPFTYLIKRIRRKEPPNYREEIVDLLDSFTPEFQFEIPHDIAAIWLQRRQYTDVKITTVNQVGYSITGNK